MTLNVIFPLKNWHTVKGDVIFGFLFAPNTENTPIFNYKEKESLRLLDIHSISLRQISVSALSALYLSQTNIESQMLCRILMWEGRFCVFVTVASTFSGFQPWVRKYPSIFAHCLKYNFFFGWKCLLMNYYAWIWCFLAGSVVLVSGFFFSGLKPTKDVRKRCLSMVLDIWYSTGTDWPRQLRRGWYWTRIQSMSSTELDWFRTRLLCIEISRWNSRSQSKFIVFCRILRFLLG